jgi:hypothetical protein
MDVRERIAVILERRRAKLPAVQAAIEHWDRISQDLRTLDAAAQELRIYPQAPQEVCQALRSIDMAALQAHAAEASRKMHLLAGRFSRDTVNIGVSGRARVGKSTLLQKLSGLSDEQIPTGSGLPVTAVRSRIVNSSAGTRARLTLHSFESFRDEVLKPYHDELGLTQLPVSVAEFKTFPYPRSEKELAPEVQQRHSSITILGRLRDEMQASLWSYEADLTGGERTIGLEQLRPYVAYPRWNEIGTPGCARRYLAVREVRIECLFPHAQVDHLGIIDLPGLGEVAANAEEHHVNGLKNDVDAVLMVKRPSEGMAYWTSEDARAIDLLDRARGFVSQRRDFVRLLINDSAQDGERLPGMREDIQRKVNEGRDGLHLRVLEADATDSQAVSQKVLTPLLDHLAERLPTMDEEILVGTRRECQAHVLAIGEPVKALQLLLSANRQSSVSSIEEVLRRSAELQKDIAQTLGASVGSLRKAAILAKQDKAYLEALVSARRDIQSWIDSGFSEGKDAWCARALRQMRVDGYSARFTGNEFNRIRVEISGRFCTLDIYLGTRVQALWGEVATLLGQHLGGLLEGEQGRSALERLASCLREAAEPCPTLAQAIEDLLSLRLDYRTQLHPRVRRELDQLSLQVLERETEQYETQVTVEVSEMGADQLFHVMSELATQATYRTYKSLTEEATTPILVLHAALEQFEDTLIRSGQSELEFARMGRSFRDDIWPGEFQAAEQSSLRVNRLRQALALLGAQLNRVEGAAA